MISGDIDILVGTSLIDAYVITTDVQNEFNRPFASQYTFEFTVGDRPAVDTALSNPAHMASGVNTAIADGIWVVLNETKSGIDWNTVTNDSVKVVKSSDGSAAPVEMKFKQGANPSVTGGANLLTVSNTAANTNVTVAGKFKDLVKVGDTISFTPQGGVLTAYTVTARSGDTLTLDAAANASDGSGADGNKVTNIVYDINVSNNAASAVVTVAGKDKDKVVVGSIIRFTPQGGVATSYRVTAKTSDTLTLNAAADASDGSGADGNKATTLYPAVVFNLAAGATGLVADTEYKVVVDGVKDVIGNSVQATELRFRTAVVPSLVSSSIANNQADVSTTPVIELTFANADMTAAGVLAPTATKKITLDGTDADDGKGINVYLENAAGAKVQAYYLVSGNTLKLLPAAPLNAYAEYKIVVKPTVLTAATKDTEIKFTTSTTAQTATLVSATYNKDAKIITLQFNVPVKFKAAGMSGITATAGSLGTTPGAAVTAADPTKVIVTLDPTDASIAAGVTQINVVSGQAASVQSVAGAPAVDIADKSVVVQ